MKSAFWRTLAVLAIVAMPTLADANDATIGSEAATSAMAGSTLNNTTALFNAWPHLVTMYGSGAEISTNNFNSNTNAGSARVWWEAYEDLWLNLNVGRMDLGTQAGNFLWGGPQSPGLMLNSFGNQLGGFDGSANPWINLGVAQPMSGGAAWSANVFFGAQGTETEPADENNPTFTDSSTGFGALVSWGNGAGLHASAEFALQTETVEPRTEGGDELEGSALAFTVNARKDTALYIYQGSVAFGSGTTQTADTDGPVDTDESFLGVLLSAGRFLKNEVDGQTSAEFTFAFTSGSTETGDDKNDVGTIVFPGVRVSAWEKITDWFGLMGGVQSVYVLSSDEDDPGGKTSSQGLDYTWTAGMFAQFTDNVRVDLEFNPAGLNDFLSWGNTTPMVAYLGATVGLD